MYVPILETLQAQLNNATVLQEITDGHKDIPAFLSDYCDGQQFHKHPLLNSRTPCFQIILYYDELEICNPLGSRRKKHKVGKHDYDSKINIILGAHIMEETQ
jgi:hypothetical protein